MKQRSVPRNSHVSANTRNANLELCSKKVKLRPFNHSLASNYDKIVRLQTKTDLEVQRIQFNVT